MCFVELENSFDRVHMKVLEWALGMKGIPGMARLVMSLNEGTKTRV